MKIWLPFAFCLLLVVPSIGFAQGDRGQRSSPMDQVAHPQAVGESGVAWYTTWEKGLAEAKRTNRPIFFMSAATTCSGVSGVF